MVVWLGYQGPDVAGYPNILPTDGLVFGTERHGYPTTGLIGLGTESRSGKHDSRHGGCFTVPGPPVPRTARVNHVFDRSFPPEDPLMTPPFDPETEPTTVEEFDAELGRLVSEARDQNVPIEGAYNVRSPDPDTRDFTIEITEIAKRFL